MNPPDLWAFFKCLFIDENNCKYKLKFICKNNTHIREGGEGGGWNMQILYHWAELMFMSFSTF